jgi:tetratricopeptide (TPR) repeat protein
VGFPSVDPRAVPFVEAALAAAAAGDLDEATRQYRAAVDVDSEPSLRAAYEATATRSKDQQYEKALGEAAEAEKAQRWAAAGAAYARAFELKPTARLAHLAATAIRHTRANLQRGLHYAEQALRLEPNRVVHHLSLSLLLQDTGDTVRARAAFEKARALDPNHPGLAAVQARLKAR